MNNIGNQQGINVQAASVPAGPGAGTPQAAMEPAQTQHQPAPLGFLDHVAAFVRSDAGKATILGLLGVGLLVAAASSSGSEDQTEDEEDEDPGSSASDELAALLHAASDQLDANRRAGARYERAVEGVLEQTFDGAEVWSQVTVTTPDGRRRRPDNVLRHPNGAMTAVEIKNVSEVTEEHVQQAEDHREGLHHTFGVRAGKTILVVPEGTVVKPEHASRVRVRTFTP